MIEESNPTNGKLYETSIQLNDIEFKNLVLKYSKLAQDPRDFGFLSHLKTYGIYHEALKEFLIAKHGKKPTQCDNLAFVLLLTYPENKIIEFTSVKDLKLAFNSLTAESDFDSVGFLVSDDFDYNSCVCNKHIINIHRFCNIYTGISINIGSDCNETYGLISKDNPNYKSTCKKIKEHKEKEREKAEGKPEGFYENERAMKKLEKEEEKLRKEEEKLRKEREKEIKIMEKEIKQLNKKCGANVYESNKCVICQINFIHNKQICCVRICSKCFKNEDKDKKYKLNNNLKNIKIDECLNCDKKSCFIKNDLCKECHKICKLNKCKMCPDKFLSELVSNDLYCPPCDENIIKCIDCKKVDVLKNSNIRCYKCDFNFINKITIKKCKHCDDEFGVNEQNKWMTHCEDCRKKGHYKKEEKKTISKFCQHCECLFIVSEEKKFRTFCDDCCKKGHHKK